MNQLESIDLTQGNRFERVLRENAQKNKPDDDRGMHRLKKGEIPHVSTNNNYITISTESIDIGDWIINLDTHQLADSLDNQIQNHTVRLNTHNNFTWFDDSANTSTLTTWSVTSNHTWNTWRSWSLNGTSSDVTDVTYYTTASNYGYNITDASDKSIEDRICLDPFTYGEDISSSNDIENRLSDLDYIYYEKPYNIPKRLLQNDVDDSWFNDYDDALSRISNKRQLNDDALMDEFLNLHIAQDSITTGNSDQLLKIQAPFIKRVYVTNGGRSFDTKELHFDMILGQEHFNEAIQRRI